MSAEELAELKDARDEARYAIWCWIINANDGDGADVDDLIQVMDSHGLTCPEELGDE